MSQVSRTRRSRAPRSRCPRSRYPRFWRLLYLQAVGAGASLEAAEIALSSAEATAERVRRRVAEGMGTEADRLQAEAALEEARAVRARALTAVADTRDALAVQLGWGLEEIPVPTQDAAEVARWLETPSTGVSHDLMARSDLLAGRAAVEAARSQARARELRRLPELQAFAGVSTHAPRINGSRESNWTVGVELSVPLFTGFALSRGAEAARARSRALTLEQDERERQARSELRTAGRAVETARTSLVSSRRAAEAAEEAVRLLRRRYEEGMATVADLLQAEARAAGLRQARVAAEADLGRALATLDFVRGSDGTPLLHDDER